MNKLLTIYKEKKEIINYLIVGVLTTIVGLVGYYALTLTILDPNNSIQLQIANIISWILAVAFAYITNRKYVFESKNTNIKKELTSFVSSRITTLIIDMAIMFIFVTIFHLNDKIIKLIDQVVVIILNYLLSKLFVFKKGIK